MKLVSITASITITAQVTLAQDQAPLVPADGAVLLGAWYDRNNSDTPSRVNARLNYKPLSFFQTDVDFGGTLKPWTAPNVVIPQFLDQLKKTNTDAMGMLTIYPYQGYSNITDKQIQDMADSLNAIVNAGHSLFVRFASEMNGSWFNYGQDPVGFLAAWKRCIPAWKKALGANSSKVAFIWSPNSGNGYPYKSGDYAIVKKLNSTDPAVQNNFKLLDTNNDNVLDDADNPYLPYYPGDDLVDWVGVSVYHYGQKFPWVDNSVPVEKEFESFLTGRPDNIDTIGFFGRYPFYSAFSGPNGVKDVSGKIVSAGNKPLIISETGAAFHFAWDDNTTDDTKRPNECNVPYCDETTNRIDIKMAWWKSFLNKDFIKLYPKIKAVCSFEFIKNEELTWRDFTTFGSAPNPFMSDQEAHPNGLKFEGEDNQVAVTFTNELKSKNMDFIVYAQAVNNSGTGVATVTGTGTSLVTTKSDAVQNAGYVAILAFVAMFGF
ncbi:glycoside hydrolase superfamily [Chytriomyces sp. MP71]|nr:glycoside hydrolase superfamily [Chytriomyces sp. MP71]